MARAREAHTIGRVPDYSLETIVISLVASNRTMEDCFGLKRKIFEIIYHPHLKKSKRLR